MKESLEKMDECWRPTKRINYLHVYRISAKENSNVEELCLTIRDVIDDLDDRKRRKSKSLDENKQKNDEDEMVPV